MKKYFPIILKFIGKYVIPIVVGYLEGDTHTIQDALLSSF